MLLGVHCTTRSYLRQRTRKYLLTAYCMSGPLQVRMYVGTFVSKSPPPMDFTVECLLGDLPTQECCDSGPGKQKVNLKWT